MSATSASEHHHITHPLDALAIGAVVMLYLSWGFNQVSVKLAIQDIPPLIQGAIRSMAATILVVGWSALRRVSLFQRDGTLIPGFAAGTLFGLEFLLIYQGLAFTTATRAVLLIYLAPFFVVLGVRIVLPADKFRPSQWIGLALSFAGMLLAFGLTTPALDPRQTLGDLMCVIAAAFWAAITLTIKASRLNRAPAEKVLLYQLSSLGAAVRRCRLGDRRACRSLAVGGGARRARLSDRLGGQLHLRDLVRADRTLFGEPAVGVLVPHAAVRGGRRSSGAGRAADSGLRGRGHPGHRRAGAGE